MRISFRLPPLLAATCAATTIVCAATPTLAQTAPPNTDPPPGVAFACHDGSQLWLDMQDDARAGVVAVVSVHGQNYRLPLVPPDVHVARIEWADTHNSLTWSPGVQLMWMGEGTHLMCGRSHHH